MTVETDIDALVSDLTSRKGKITTVKSGITAAVSEATAKVGLTDKAAQAALAARNEASSIATAAGTLATASTGATALADLSAVLASKGVTAVDVFVYDTSLDSDGGAWRYRTTGTSWYNETLNTATRGARREFPAVAVLVLTSGNLTIYDGDDPSLPMWMVFYTSTGSVAAYGNAVTSVFALNGEIAVGSAGTGGLSRISLFEKPYQLLQGTIYYTVPARGYLVNRNGGVGWPSPVSDATKSLINTVVNDIAMTVLPDAPVDPATGLPVPTIAVATAGGVSVIKADGTVVDATRWAFVKSVSFTSDLKLIAQGDSTASNGGKYTEVYDPTTLTDTSSPGDESYRNGGLTTPTTFNVLTTGAANGYLDNTGSAIGFAIGLCRLDRNPSAPTTGMVAYTTSTYNTGWMPGAIRGAFLSDTDNTDLVAATPVDDDFSTYADTAALLAAGWTETVNAAVTLESGKLRVSATAAGAVTCSKAISLTVGVRYRVSGDLVAETLTNQALVAIGSTNTNLVFSQTLLSGAKIDFEFVAPQVDMWLNVYGNINTLAGQYVEVDNLRIERVDNDRSVNTKGLIVNGTITRSPVADGAELVAYSGFSPTNYLEQSYNSALDFGTGDFCVMGWAKNQQLYDTFFVRSDGSTAATEFMLQTGAVASDLRFYLGGAFVTRSGVLPTAGWHHLVVLREAGSIKIYSNGRLVDTFANSSNVTQAGATLVFGDATNSASPAGSDPFGGSLALWRISATAPTADQIKKIYEDEKHLFQPGAKCTLYGTSDAVTALAYDKGTELLHVGTSAGRSVFDGLVRVSNTTVGVGTAISAHNGLIVEE